MKSSCALNMDLASRYSKWLLAQKYALVTRNQYSKAVRDYAQFLGEKRFADSNHFDVQEYIAVRETQGMSARALRGSLYALRIFFDFLNLGGLVMWVAPRLVRSRPLQPRVPRVLTKDQVGRLFTRTRTLFERAVLETLYGTGCRTGELLSMRIKDEILRPAEYACAVRPATDTSASRPLSCTAFGSISPGGKLDTSS